MKYIKLTLEQGQNTKALLNRVEIKGIDEATALLQIVNAIDKPYDDGAKMEKKKEGE
jgi:hypothetical protein